jgi:hypothetical protein
MVFEGLRRPFDVKQPTDSTPAFLNRIVEGDGGEPVPAGDVEQATGDDSRRCQSDRNRLHRVAAKNRQ